MNTDGNCAMTSCFPAIGHPRSAKYLMEASPAPLLLRDDHNRPSVFRPENMLREARRQKGLPPGRVPPFCVLDPDGDIVRYVRKHKNAVCSSTWACYHTKMWEWDEMGERYGIVGSAVGGAFSVLVAEQLFASGCHLLISVGSAGQIIDIGPPPYHILVERALRDEGTSYHYLPPSTYVEADPEILAVAANCFARAGCVVRMGATWTTDAPFRETAETIAARKRDGILAVEMEAAALYAFATACFRPVICIAHVTNKLGCIDGDFEKGDNNGAGQSLTFVNALFSAWQLPRNLEGVNHDEENTLRVVMSSDNFSWFD
jgi:uridine phosphorylase